MYWCHVSEWWTWSRDAVKGLPPRYLLLQQKARVKTRHESQTPLSPQTEKYDRTGRPVVCAHSSSYSEGNIDKTWSSQEYKSGELMDDRTVRPAVCSQQADQFIIENDETTSYTEAESELSLGSRSFLHRVNDQVQKRHKQSSKDATKYSDKHSLILDMFIVEYLPRIHHIAALLQSPRVLDKNERTTRRFHWTSMFNDISWWSKDNEKECEFSPKHVSIYAKRFSPGRWSFFGFGWQKKCILLTNTNHKENGTELWIKWW